MPTISQEKREKIARDYCNGATYKDLIKKYKCGSSTIHRALSTFKADWFDFDKIKKERKEEKKIKPPDNIEQIARDFKNGAYYDKLQEKYGYKHHQLRNFLMAFKADWFNFKSISKEHSKYNRVNNKHLEQDGSVYVNFLNTLKSCGLTDAESWAVMNLMIKKSNTNYCVDQLTNQESVNRIIEKIKIQSLKIAFMSAISRGTDL